MNHINLEALGPRPEQGVSVALIAARLSDAIQSGLIKEGSLITQQALADHFGVSRMPAREALRQVGARGFIEHRLNRTSIVVQPKAFDNSAERLQRLEAQLRQAKEVFDFMYRDPQAAASCWREMAGQQADDIEALLASTH